MTEAEKAEQIARISELLVGLQDAQASYIAIFLTGIFAFILAAHTSGATMTRLQVFLTSSIFSLFAFVIGTRIIGFGAGINEVLIDLKGYQAESELGRYEFVDRSVRLTLASVVWSSGPIVALVYMWSVRHPKTK